MRRVQGLNLTKDAEIQRALICAWMNKHPVFKRIINKKLKAVERPGKLSAMSRDEILLTIAVEIGLTELCTEILCHTDLEYAERLLAQLDADSVIH